jgi:hypothetical protein
MRKQYKVKHRSCGLCKPHKRGLTHRWRPHDQQAMREAEREMVAARTGAASGAAER